MVEDRKTNQWDRIKKTDINKYNQLIFDRSAKAIQWGKKRLSNKLYWYMNLDPYLK